MTYYYKRLSENGSMAAIGTQQFPVTQNTGINDVAITEAEYSRLMEEIMERSSAITEYVGKVKVGELSVAEVPEEYRAEVERIVNTPEPEPPNNPYGIPDEKYEEIKQGIVNEIVAGAKENVQ